LQANAATRRIGRIRAIGIGQIATLALVGGIAGGAGARLVTRWLIVSAIDQESDRLQAAMDGLKPPALRTRQKPLASQATATAYRSHKG
jgi:hypothetical protein